VKIAIMQPTYLPWSGYFNLIAVTGQFVFLDDVQFSVRSWQQRNRILVNGQPCTLTIPVLTHGRGPQRICDVHIDPRQHWKKKHIGTLRQAYARHPFGREVADLVESVLAVDRALLMDINMDLVRAICGVLGLQPQFHRSSEAGVCGSRSERLVNLCRRYGADTYLSPLGSKAYIEKDGVFASSEIKLQYQSFLCPPYPQRGTTQFVSHMSIVDLLSNVGFAEGRKYVEQSFCDPRARS
jgi:hypothetical protein